MQTIRRTCDGGCGDPTPPVTEVEIKVKGGDQWHRATYCRECYLAAEAAVGANARGLAFNMISDTVAIRLVGSDGEGYTG